MKFTPAQPYRKEFRAIFVGALIKRKGVTSWKRRRLQLPNAEGSFSSASPKQMEPYLKEFRWSGC